MTMMLTGAGMLNVIQDRHEKEEGGINRDSFESSVARNPPKSCEKVSPLCTADADELLWAYFWAPSYECC